MRFPRREPSTDGRATGGCALAGRDGRVDGARSESGAAREQAVIGEIVEGFSQDGRGLHDDLLQRVHRRGARFHGGIPCDLELADHLDACTYGKPHTHGSRDRSRGRGAGERWQREHRGRALRERRRVAGVLRTFLRPPRGLTTVHDGRQAA